MTTIKERILKLHDTGKGLGVRAIARQVNRSAMQVSRVIAASEKEKSAGCIPTLLRQLNRAVKAFAIEREGHLWKIVNYELRIGARPETSQHHDLPTVIREAIGLWARV